MDSVKDSRHKRLKVGRACYTCRAKKIKCDGLRPCMQCKARNRPCTFYKDGSFDPDQEMPEDHVPVQRESTATTPDSSSSTTGSIAATAVIGAEQYAVGPTERPNDTWYLFADTKDSNYTRNKRRGAPLESRTSNILASLGESLRKVSLYDTQSGKTFLDIEPFGNFIKWISEPPMPSRYTGSIEMPSREAQMELLEYHFSEHYESLPIIPKRYFFDQLRCKGSFITPLLLNAIYAQASRFSTDPTLPKSEIFYHRAKRLLDDFLDIPRVSTVIALCYMSLYEPTPPIHRNSSPYCRAWMYSGMAFRMCLELGLHNQSNICKELQPDDIELRKRVYWACYFLDKFQSSVWERPWLLSSRLANVELPSETPEDDEQERQILQCFIEKVKYAQLVEDGLMDAWNFPQQRTAKTSSGEKNSSIDKNKSDVYSLPFSESLRKLPPELQWTPTSTLSVDEVMRLPAPQPKVAHLHIHYNISILEGLFRAPNNAFNQFQRRITATCMTQLVDFVCDRPGSTIKFDFLIHVVLAAIKVHVRYLYSGDVNIARQAWALFEKCILIVHKIQKFAVIPNAGKFLQHLTNSFEGSDMSNGFEQSIMGITNNNINGQQQQQQQQQQLMMNMAAAVPQPPTTMTSAISDNLGDMYATMDRSAAMATAFHSDQSSGDYIVMSMNQSHQGWPNTQPILQQQQQQQQQERSTTSPTHTPLIMDQSITQNMPVIGRKGSDMIHMRPELMMQHSRSTSAFGVGDAPHHLYNAAAMTHHHHQQQQLHSQQQQQQQQQQQHQHLWDQHQE